jgi:hypothetical protein
MAFSDFDLRKVLTEFALIDDESTDLFPAVTPVEPSETLRAWLEEFAPLALGIGSERGRSEAIIFPILGEAKRRSRQPVNVASGVTFDVDKARGLTGICDYLITRSRATFFVRGPVFAAVEAKKEDITGGLGQCAAEMIAVRLFNEKENTPVPSVFGCVTSGNIWRFLKLEGDGLFIDKTEYYLPNLPKILGILVSIANG